MPARLENHQPYFTTWKSNFGSFFYLFFIGSILLFYNLVKPIKKHKNWLTVIFALFLSAFIFSRYSKGSPIFNGETPIAIFLYLGSLIIFALTIAILYFYSYYKDKEVFYKFTKLNKYYIFVFVWFFLMIVAARGAIRLFYVFSPITAILASYLTLSLLPH